MITRADSDAELAANLVDIEAVQHAAISTTGFYKRILAVPSTTGISVSNYRGGGSGPDAGWRDPGYLICQHATENGVAYCRITDHGDSGRTTEWGEL